MTSSIVNRFGQRASAGPDFQIGVPALPTRHQALDAFRLVRSFSSELTQHLEPEDCAIQSMPDVSPTRWHLAHTTWFFETFILRPADTSYRSPNSQFEVLFNSYYNSIGDQFPRSRRGLLSRPTLREVWDYRYEIDRRIEYLLTEGLDDQQWGRFSGAFQIGIQHEQQHQELMLTDIKHVFSCNPLLPEFDPLQRKPTTNSSDPAEVPFDSIGSLDFLHYDGGIFEIGHQGDTFCYDNETPRHKVLLHDFEFAQRLVTNAEFLSFIEHGGYENPQYWLSMGWESVKILGWKGPLYWSQRDDEWFEFTLYGEVPLDLDSPVCHISYFEADAYARWAGVRLPTEAEWEVVAAGNWEQPTCFGRFADDGVRHPTRVAKNVHAARELLSPSQLFGDCWEWTSSPYIGYPGYQPAKGAIGEYNGKFMCNQFVLRGGSVATFRNHIRPTYRNFFPPDARWQFSGIRLAR